jgi:predicted aspartyl protease
MKGGLPKMEDSLAIYKFSPWHYSNFIREGGHIYIFANFITGTSTYSLSFIVDSGAYISVLSRNNAKRIGLPLTGKPSANLLGFDKNQQPSKAEVITVPRICVGKYLIDDVKVLVPLDDRLTIEVLGENVLEYFNYVTDHEKDRIYFSKNPNPKPYKNPEKGLDLSCGRVLLQDGGFM